MSQFCANCGESFATESTCPNCHDRSEVQCHEDYTNDRDIEPEGIKTRHISDKDVERLFDGCEANETGNTGVERGNPDVITGE